MKKLIHYFLGVVCLCYAIPSNAWDDPTQTYNISVGERVQVIAPYWMVQIDNYSEVRWESDNNDILHLDYSGTGSWDSWFVNNVTCKKAFEGTLYLHLYYKKSGDSYWHWDGPISYAFKCKIPVTKITLNHESLEVPIDGGDIFLEPAIYPDNASDKSVNWLSSNTKVATVEDWYGYGQVTLKSPGTTTITCKANDGSGISARCKITVLPEHVEPTAITISPSSKTIKVGEKFKANYTLTPSNATTTVTWSSDDKGIATVDQSGNVKGVKEGSTYINVKTANGKTDKVKLKVEAAPMNSTNVVQVAAGGDRSFFQSSDGTLLACGRNYNGELGDGTTMDNHLPAIIMTDVQSVSSGIYHSLFLKKDGSVWACGANDFGELGDGTTTDRHTPVKIMTDVQSVSARYRHSLFLKKDGSVWACGYNINGQLGDGTTKDKQTPVKILTDVQSVSAGNLHSLFLKKDGSVLVCGDNDNGQLGDGTTSKRRTPVKILTDVQFVSAGGHHSLFLKKDGSVWACGDNFYGQLGDGTTADKSTPVEIFDGTIDASIDETVVQQMPTVNGRIFSISGQRLNAPRKGINIIGGKKVVVK